MSYEWPDDPGFRRVASRIADAVTVALATGVVLRPYGYRWAVTGCRCPLGYVDLTGPRFPIYAAAASLGIPAELTEAFASGFDGAAGDDLDGQERAYFCLGQAYRERFFR